MPTADPLAGAAPDAEPRGASTLALLVVAVVAVSAVMTDRPLTDPRLVVYLVLGASVLALHGIVADRLSRYSAARRLVAYYLPCFALVAGMQWLVGSLGSFGLTWILHLPPLGEAWLRRHRVIAWTLSIAVPLAAGVQAAALGGKRSVVEAVIGVATGVLFVVLFATHARRETEARIESERLRAELERSNQELRSLASTAEELAVARERNRIAREIHDSLGHYLTVIGVQLEAAAADLASDPESAAVRVARSRELARSGLSDVRRSVAALSSTELGAGAFAGALEELVAEVAAADSWTRLDHRVEGRARSLPPAVAQALFRAAQEGLTNVRKHARARSVELLVDFTAPTAVRLEVRDDGVGAGAVERGFGLRGVEHRARDLGGRVEVAGRAGGGFVLAVEIPA